MTRVFRLKQTTAHEQFGNETVIVNLERGSYYSTQDTGHTIWKLVVEGIAEGEILRRVAVKSGEHGQDSCRLVSEFLNQLLAEQLIDAESRADIGTERPDDQRTWDDGPFVAPILQKYTDMEELLQFDPVHEVDEAGWPSVKGLPG